MLPVAFLVLRLVWRLSILYCDCRNRKPHPGQAGWGSQIWKV